MPHFEKLAAERNELNRLANIGKLPAGTILPPETGRSRDVVAEKFNVNPNSVQQAKAVLMNAPDLALAVKAGTQAIDNAYRELKARQAASPGAYDGSKAHESDESKLASRVKTVALNALSRLLQKTTTQTL